MRVIPIIIDESTSKLITGLYEFDRDSGGTLIIPSGTTFPSSPVAKELFWKTDESVLYRRNDTNTAWEGISGGGIPDPHASSHASGGSDELTHSALAGIGSNSHAVIDAHLSSSANPHNVSAAQIGALPTGTKLDDLGAPDDNTDLNASTSTHGLLRKLSGNAAEYLDGTGNFSTPAGGGGDDDVPMYIAVDNGGGLSVVGGVIVPLETESSLNTPGLVSNSQGDLTVNVAGRYKIEADVTTQIVSGTARTETVCWLEVNRGSSWDLVTGTRRLMYNREVNEGGTSAALTTILDLEVGDRLVVWCERLSGGNDVVLYAGGSSIVITELKGAKGDKGDDGATGSGSNINIQDGGVPLGLADTLNFGTNLNVIDDGNGDFTIEAVSSGGSSIEEYATDNQAGLTTSAGSWVVAETLTFTPTVGGDNWEVIVSAIIGDIGSDADPGNIRVTVDGTEVRNDMTYSSDSFRLEAIDSYSAAFKLSALDATQHQISLEIYPVDGWVTMSVRDIYIRARRRP